MTHAQKDSLIGTRIREYEVLELLGKGGMGAVYRARHAYLEEERAIKVIQGRRTGESAFIERFIREAKILTKLRHTNLVQLYEFGNLETDSFFMVMELIRGESLWHRIRRIGRIPIPDAVRIIREAASGLQCAHQNGIIHRDISPDNFILLNDRDPEVTKVIDFGIAKPLLESLQLTASNLFIGKPEYCSPEQCAFAENKQPLDGRSDIYSLAITFYQMLTGNLPFQSKSPQGFFMKHAHEIPDAPSTHFPAGSFPESLDRLILKALSKRREDRHESLGQFLADLDSYSEQPVISVPLFAEPEIDQVFAGRYLIEKKLGKGEMGMVFRATDQILNIPVALKTVSFDIAEDEKMLARFKREVILARKVSHTNVCRVYDIGESANVHYVSMELVEGRTLADAMRSQGRFSLEIALPILEQVLYAIRETHRAGIIHRDLKPQNIMIDQRQHLKIMDFGISLSPDFSRITQTGSLLGTPHYMAPEVFEEKPVDGRADLYSIGVLMYSMFTGRLPFDGPTPIAVIYAHLKGDPPKPSDVVPSFPQGLEKIILKTLQKDPENRYASADEILHDLALLTQPATDAKSQASEQLTHRLIAEHRYGKAIKVLQSLLKEHPDHPRWKKLLKGAVAEKTKRDINRTRMLIRKGNFMQAEFCLERISGSQLEVTGALSKVNRLQEMLVSGKKGAVNSYIQEAEERLCRNDYLAAMASLESAWHLQPNDPDIIRMQERIQFAQEAETVERYESKLNEARSFLLAGEEEQAFSLVQEVLAEDSSHRSAKAFRDEILNSRWEKVQDQIKQGLELAMQPLAFCDFEVAQELLLKLQKELEIESCRKEIGRIHQAIALLDSDFQTERFYDVSHHVQKLVSRDPFGWLEPYRSAFAEIEKVAEERLLSRQTELQRVLTECKTLLNQSRYPEALMRLGQFQQTESIPDLEDLRSEILSQFREARMSEAQNFAAQLEWERAIVRWKEILQYFPDSTEIQDIVKEAETRLQAELQIQKELLTGLRNCYSLILKDHWVEAQDLAQSLLKSIRPGHRLIEIERQIESLLAEILVHNREQSKHREIVTRELSQIRKLFMRGAQAEALEKISLVLETEFVEQEALELKISIEKAIQAQSVTLRFQSAVQKGKEYFERRNWQKAIEFWKKANSLSDESYVKDRIEEAEQQWKKERQIRLSIIAMLAETDELIFYSKFTEATRKIEKCKKALSDEFSLDDLAEQVRRITLRLANEIKKEENLRAETQAELEEAALMHHEKLYPQALQKVDAILQQDPEMEAAIQLKVLIEASLEEERNVLEILRAVIKLVVKRDFKHLPGLLLKLKETSVRTHYAEDCVSIVDEMPLLVLEIESGDQTAVQERLDRMFSRSLLLLEYEQTLRNFVESLKNRNQKEKELDAALADGIERLESGDLESVSESLKAFQEIVKGKQSRKESPINVDQTAGLTDDDLKLSDIELITLEHTLLHHEVESILARAHDTFMTGDLSKARELFLEVLKIEPENPVALDGLRQTEK